MNVAARISAAAPAIASPRPATPEWIYTPTAERVMGALAYAQAVPDVAVIYGGTGVGKSATAAHYAAVGANVWHATMTPATSGVVPALEEVCAALGIPTVNGAAPLHRAIVRKASDTGGLLIVDEAQHLAPPALEQLRGIHDAAGIGLALLGSKEVHARLVGGDSAATLERLRARIGKRLALSVPSAGDVDAIADAWGVNGAAARKLLNDIAAKAGGLRGVVKALRLATMQAHTVGRAVTDTDVRAAGRELCGL